LKQLEKFYPGSKERVGYVLSSGKIVEVPNISNDPENSFDVSGDDILKYAIDGSVIATWHTHPDKSSNLSVDDYTAFKNFPALKHYVIGNDGVRCYVVRCGAIFHEA
jgi:proteasome lid subunit RPN8/RPN11